MPDIPRNLIRGLSGLMVAADVQEHLVEKAMAGRVVPIRVVLHDMTDNKLLELECRPITSEEAVMLINRYLMEGKIEFGFRKKENTYGGPVLS
jgi:hypothetical protein